MLKGNSCLYPDVMCNGLDTVIREDQSTVSECFVSGSLSISMPSEEKEIEVSVSVFEVKAKHKKLTFISSTSKSSSEVTYKVPVKSSPNPKVSLLRTIEMLALGLNILSFKLLKKVLSPYLCALLHH